MPNALPDAFLIMMRTPFDRPILLIACLLVGGVVAPACTGGPPFSPGDSTGSSTGTGSGDGTDGTGATGATGTTGSGGDEDAATTCNANANVFHITVDASPNYALSTANGTEFGVCVVAQVYHLGTGQRVVSPAWLGLVAPAAGSSPACRSYYLSGKIEIPVKPYVKPGEWSWAVVSGWNGECDELPSKPATAANMSLYLKSEGGYVAEGTYAAACEPLPGPRTQLTFTESLTEIHGCN